VIEPAGCLAAMDFLILPSRWEGAPLTVVEAMAAGLPVIASDLPGVRWLLAGAPERESDPTRGAARWNGATPASPAQHLGTFAPAGATESFIDAVRRLAADPVTRRREGEAAQRIALSRLSIDRMLEDLLGLYAS
jgi:glycosyltransferase involved in cell wall biosynthesis